MTIAEILRTTSIEILTKKKQFSISSCAIFHHEYAHENDPVVPIVMHLAYSPVHRHINDRIYDNCVHLLIAHKYEIFPEDNAIYNHRLHDARTTNLLFGIDENKDP